MTDEELLQCYIFAERNGSAVFVRSVERVTATQIIDDWGERYSRKG